MTYKVFSIIVPLVISSIIDIPSKSSFDTPKARISSKFSLLPISEEPVQEDYFNCTTFGPFSLSTVTNGVNVTFTYQLYSVSSQNIIERVRLLNSSNSVVASSSKSSKYYNRGSQNSVTFSLPIRDHLTVNGLTLKYEIVNASSYTILKAYSSTFYPSSDSFINWMELKQNPHVSKALGFYSDGKTMKPLIETIDFTSFGDYLDVDYYYRLELNKNYISYPNDCEFRYASASLTFNDSEMIFPYYEHQSSGDISIPLSMVRNGNSLFFKFKNTFYINKRTLQMSNIYRNGFVTSKDFYLPINGRSRFNGKQIFFVLEGLGNDNISTSFPLRYDVTSSLVGVCTDGDYCIVGGRR